MSTRWKVNPWKSQVGLMTGLEGIDIPEDFDLPSCGIEDVDRAVFKLFNEDLPLYFELDGEQKRVPCIFAGGERAMILRRKQPLRDRQGALVLPLVSVLRSGIDQEAEKAIGQGEGTITLRKRLAPEDRVFKKQANQSNLINQDGVAPALYKGANASLDITTRNVFEVITMPTPRFFTATYDVTFWAQYLTQMNNLMEALITSYNNQAARSFKIESDKGYWFVAQVESGLNDSNNFDGYNDDERLIKTSVSLKVTGYIINPKYSGAPSPFRRFVSAPKVQFETNVASTPTIHSNQLPSSDPEDYVYDDLANEKYPLPGGAVGTVDMDGPEFSLNIGGTVRDNSSNQLKSVRLATPPKDGGSTIQSTTQIEDPFSNKPATAKVKSSNPWKGETVYIIIETLNQEGHN